MTSFNKIDNGRISFLLLAISLLIGFYFNEDASGGGKGDFYNTWGYNLALQKDLLVDPTAWTVHFPLHHIILSRLIYLIEDQYLLRLFLCTLSISVPLLFYLNLKIKFDKVDKNKLLFLASLIFIIPAFRYSAIWANNHITASIFFLLSTLFFLKWQKKQKNDELSLNVILNVIFLSLAVYTRQYYALFFLYFMFLYLQKLKFLTFIKLSLIVLILSLPGFLLVSGQQELLLVTFTNKLANSILVNSSIIAFFLIPIFILVFIQNKNLFKDNQKFFYVTLICSIVFVSLLSILFNYNPSLGGGFILKLSVLLFNNNFLFYLSAILGFIFFSFLAKEDKNNLALIILLVLGFSAYMIFQKYFEPTFLFLFFLIFNTKISKYFLNDYKNLLFLYIYMTAYLISAIVNDIYQITHRYL